VLSAGPALDDSPAAVPELPVCVVADPIDVVGSPLASKPQAVAPTTTASAHAKTVRRARVRIGGRDRIIV
jgi:hypothetical protein